MTTSNFKGMQSFTGVWDCDTNPPSFPGRSNGKETAWWRRVCHWPPRWCQHGQTVWVVWLNWCDQGKGVAVWRAHLICMLTRSLLSSRITAGPTPLWSTCTMTRWLASSRYACLVQPVCVCTCLVPMNRCYYIWIKRMQIEWACVKLASYPGSW